jgi:hypothetical protein
MEGQLCAMALKSTNGRQEHHTRTGLHVYCKPALKSYGMREAGGGAVWETARAKEVILRIAVRGLCVVRWR